MMSFLPPKKDVAVALIERASVFVHLDPRKSGVRVPNWLKQQPQLVLQIGLAMAVTIPDLEISDDALSCTLSFDRRPHPCYVPWEAVFALVGEDGRGMVWPEDIPAEVIAETQKKRPLRVVGDTAKTASHKKNVSQKTGAQKAGAQKTTPQPMLVAVDGKQQDSGSNRSNDKRSAAPHLRLVK